MFVRSRFLEDGLRKYFLPGFGKQPVEVFPVPDVDECEQHPYLFPQVFPAQLFPQGPLMDTAAKFHSLFDQEHQHAKGCRHIGKVLVSMAVIMLEIVAKNIFQGGKSFIFNFRMVPKGRHALVVFDGAGWHRSKDLACPGNVSVLRLPPYSPELNPAENVFQFLKSNHFANRVFETVDDVKATVASVWEDFTGQPGQIKSIGARSWAKLQ